MIQRFRVRLSVLAILIAMVPSIPLAGQPAYEEGTWIPVVGGSNGESGQVYQYQTGTYTKFGRLVVAHAHVQYSNQGTINGNLQLKGLPYPSGGAGGGFLAGSVGFFSNLTPTADLSSMMLYMGRGVTFANIMGVDQGQYMNPRFILGSEVNPQSQFIFTFAYETN
jgi:hypothetical protein